MAIAFQAAKSVIETKPPVAAIEPVLSAIPTPSKPAGAKRGRKPSGNSKKLLTLRLDPDVIEGFKATGEGWQSRMNDALRVHLKL